MEDNKEKETVDQMHDEIKHEDVKKEKRNKHKEQVEALELEIKDLKDKFLRNVAELDNFKKRMTQERINDRKFASKNLINDFLVPLEQLDKVCHMQTDNELLKNFLIGFKMINDQFYNILTQDGLKEIDALNKPFDPNYHYAIEKVSNKGKTNGINLEVVQKGYLYKDQILRPAMVKVNEWSDENGKDE
ncbi:MAG: nucleotide exchange factor GrpE [Acholeplasmataceae bacterium]|jgi:molecular chaperone GrpE|nr:nucleotide exchange factor GrpE [Acholeplasmataceae bacterium]